MRLPAAVKLTEVGPRDGFQMEEKLIPTELKIWAVQKLAEAGIPEIEATSFVSPKVVPQMHDAAEVMAAVPRELGTRWAALAVNLKGAQRAIDARADVVRMVVCVSESYNRKNAGQGVAEALEQTAKITELAAAAKVVSSVTIALATGCPIEGDVPTRKVFDMVRQVVDMGVDEIVVADSAGLGNPRQIAELSSGTLELAGGRPVSLHLHDTRGLGIANALTAMQEGITILDCSLGGLGGCPTHRGSKGNIATEDIVYMCHELGIETGIDISRVRTVSRRISEFLGRELPSRVLEVGTREELYDRGRCATDG